MVYKQQVSNNTTLYVFTFSFGMYNIYSTCLSRRKKQKMFKMHAPLPSSLGVRYVENSLLSSIILLYTGCTPCSYIFMTKWCFWNRSKRVRDLMKKHKNKFLKCFSSVLEHIKMKNFSAPQPAPKVRMYEFVFKSSTCIIGE